MIAPTVGRRAQHVGQVQPYQQVIVGELVHQANCLVEDFCATVVAGREIGDQPPLGWHLGGGLLQQRIDIVSFGEVVFSPLQNAVSHGAVDALHAVNGLAPFQCLWGREAGFERSPRQAQHEREVAVHFDQAKTDLVRVEDCSRFWFEDPQRRRVETAVQRHHLRNGCRPAHRHPRPVEVPSIVLVHGFDHDALDALNRADEVFVGGHKSDGRVDDARHNIAVGGA